MRRHNDIRVSVFRKGALRVAKRESGPSLFGASGFRDADRWIGYGKEFTQQGLPYSSFLFVFLDYEGFVNPRFRI